MSVAIHPDWRLLRNGTLFNRFTLDRFECSPRERAYLEALIKGTEPHVPSLREEFETAGVITTQESSDSLFEEYEQASKRTDDIRINRARFVITERCNMGCPGCFVRFKYRNDEEFLNTDEETAHTIVDELYERNRGGNFHIHFLGGEPLVGFEIMKETINYARGRCDGDTSCSFSVTTNATVVTNEIAHYLNKQDVTVGVSFDGWEEINDKTRMYMSGDGTYEDAVDGYRTLQDHLDNVGILITPQPANIDDLAAVARHLLEELEPDALTINNPFHSDGTWDIDGWKFAEKMKAIIQLCERQRVPLVSPATQIIGALSSQNPKTQTLTTADRHFTINVSPDSRLSYHIMNYDEELFPNDLGDASTERFEKWASFSGYQNKECQDCVALNTCGGPDPIESYHGTGHVDELELNPDRCVFYQEMTQWLASKL